MFAKRGNPQEQKKLVIVNWSFLFDKEQKSFRPGAQDFLKSLQQKDIEVIIPGRSTTFSRIRAQLDTEDSDFSFIKDEQIPTPDRLNTLAGCLEQRVQENQATPIQTTVPNEILAKCASRLRISAQLKTYAAGLDSSCEIDIVRAFQYLGNYQPSQVLAIGYDFTADGYRSLPIKNKQHPLDDFFAQARAAITSMGSQQPVAQKQALQSGIAQESHYVTKSYVKHGDRVVTASAEEMKLSSLTQKRVVELDWYEVYDPIKDKLIEGFKKFLTFVKENQHSVIISCAFPRHHQISRVLTANGFNDFLKEENNTYIFTSDLAPSEKLRQIKLKAVKLPVDRDLKTDLFEQAAAVVDPLADLKETVNTEIRRLRQNAKKWHGLYGFRHGKKANELQAAVANAPQHPASLRDFVTYKANKKAKSLINAAAYKRNAFFLFGHAPGTATTEGQINKKITAYEKRIGISRVRSRS